MSGLGRTFKQAHMRQKLDILLDFIVSYKKEHDGESPTIRYIMDRLDIASTSMTAFYIQKLIDEGRLYRVHAYSGGHGLGVPGGRWDIVIERETE